MRWGKRRDVQIVAETEAGSKSPFGPVPTDLPFQMAKSTNADKRTGITTSARLRSADAPNSRKRTSIGKFVNNGLAGSIPELARTSSGPYTSNPRREPDMEHF